MVNYESNKIINKKTYFTGERYTNFSIKPKTMDELPENIELGTLFYCIYWNLVFDLTYIKLNHGKWFWLKFLNIKLIAQRLVYAYLGISRLFLKLINHALRLNKEKSIETYIFFNFIRKNDNRIILKINNEWKINNGREIFKHGVKKLLVERNLSENQILWAVEQFEICYNKMQDIKHETITKKVLFVSKDLPKIPHSAFPSLTKNTEILAYQTSYQIAEKKSFYGKQPIINWYQGPTKESTILPFKERDTRQISDLKDTSILKQMQGAIKKGYDREIISDEWATSIEDFRLIDTHIEKVLSELEIRDNTLKNLILRDLISFVDTTWVEPSADK